jgi:hypothetical protein
VSVATPPSPRPEELGPAGGWGPDRLKPGDARGDAAERPTAEGCPLCGGALGAEQEWCLRCGAAARTRLAATPSWRAPVIALATVIVLSLGALTAALVSLAGSSEGSGSTVAVTRTVTTPAVAAPPVTTPTTAIGTASTPGSIGPGASTTTPGTSVPRTGTTATGKTAPPTTTAPLGGSTHSGTTVTPTNTSTGSAPATGSGAAKGTKTKGNEALERDFRAYQRHQDKVTGAPAG